ncbi:transposase [Paenibacillus prosopidis]|uniref:transposase n=1 Tax=Paenibacillus prosopidis TaxID=630520 RepID=UPI003CCC6E90
MQGELERLYDDKVNHKKVLRLMQEMGIRSIICAKRPYFSKYQVAKPDGGVAQTCSNVNLRLTNLIRNG